MAGTTKIITSPAAGTQIKPIHTYTDEQRVQIDALREVGIPHPPQNSLTFNNFLGLQYTDSLLLPSTDPYYPWEHQWVNHPDTIPRYMRAAKWKFDDAKKRIKGTLEWRRDFKPDLIPPDEVRFLECFCE
jgi:hypothetical protein